VVVDLKKGIMTTFTTEDRLSVQKFPEIVRDKCPCDDCKHSQRCKEEEIACRPFAKFVLDNWYYRDTPRDPCHGTFNKIFNQSDDLALKNYIRNFKEGNVEHKTEGDKGE
jgi:hypothetical protein